MLAETAWRARLNMVARLIMAGRLDGVDRLGKSGSLGLLDFFQHISLLQYFVP